MCEMQTVRESVFHKVRTFAWLSEMAKDKPLIHKENFSINRLDLFARLVYLYKFSATTIGLFIQGESA